MKVLVTGHKGFIGKNLVKYIEDNTDWEVTGWEWNDSPFPTIDGKDWVIHLGAISSTTEQDVDKILKQNYEFSQRIFNACKLLYTNLQYSSSASVYGLKDQFSENSPVDPRNPYAWSKYLFDRWVQTQEHFKTVQGFRYFNVYGNMEGHKGGQASPLTQFTKQALETGKIKLFKNSEQYLRDFICVEDVCRIHVEFIKRVADSGIWNLGTGSTRSFASVAELISKKHNSSIEYIDMPDILKSSYQKYTCADISKLESVLGPQKFVSLEDWLARS